MPDLKQTDFISERVQKLEAYTYGEQPVFSKKLIKLNTNENPYPLHSSAQKILKKFDISRLRYYPDPSCTKLTALAAKALKIKPENIVFGNGSDELISAVFRIFFNPSDSVLFTDPTYSYYRVFSETDGIKTFTLPSSDDFTLDLSRIKSFDSKVVFLTNPNVPAGIFIEPAEIEKAIQQNPDKLFIIDEAYADFSSDNCLKLISKYANLIVLRTSSKAYSFCAGRLGWACAQPQLIKAFYKIKDPYNVNTITQLLGEGIFTHQKYYQKNIKRIIATRVKFSKELTERGFEVWPSRANFVLIRKAGVDAGSLFSSLRKKEIFVRWFNTPRLKDCLRISIGTDKEMRRLLEQMDIFLRSR